MRAWRGPHKIVHVLQGGRVRILDSGQKVQFERLKPHHAGPTEFVAIPAGSGEVVVVMDPEPAYDDGLPLFSQHVVVPEVPQTQEVSTTPEAEESLAGTSAPLLTNPSMTEMPISIPQLPNDTSNPQDTGARNTGLPKTNKQPARNNLPSTRGWGRS